MSFDRFFKVGLLVVLGALVVAYLLNSQERVYAQQPAAGRVATYQVGHYQLAIDADKMYAIDTMSGQVYELRERVTNPGPPPVVKRRWERIHRPIR